MVWSGSSPTHKLRAGRTARLTRVTRVTASVVTLNSLSACRSSRHIHGLSCQSERSVRKSFPSKFENKSSSTEATRSMCRVQIISVSARTERKSNRELWSGLERCANPAKQQYRIVTRRDSPRMATPRRRPYLARTQAVGSWALRRLQTRKAAQGARPPSQEFWRTRLVPRTESS